MTDGAAAAAVDVDASFRSVDDGTYASAADTKDEEGLLQGETLLFTWETLFWGLVHRRTTSESAVTVTSLFVLLPKLGVNAVND